MNDEITGPVVPDPRLGGGLDLTPHGKLDAAADERMQATLAEVVAGGDTQAVIDGTTFTREQAALLVLDALAGLWEEEAEARRKGAERSQLFGPKMMILAAEGSVMLACAGQLREAIKIAAQLLPREETGDGG